MSPPSASPPAVHPDAFLSSGRPSRAVAPVLLAAVLVLLGACRDSPTDPVIGLVAGETELAALALELPLVVPRDDSDAPEGLRDAVSAWHASWDEPLLEGRVIRRALHPRLGIHLEATRSAAALAEELDLLGVGVRRASVLRLEELPEFLGAGVQRAREAERAARRAVEEGAMARAWALLLAGADALREVGPEAVARSAVLELEERLRRIEAPASYGEEQWERIRHLVQGSRQAVGEGDWGRALRRAFYARELLDGNG